MNYLKKALGFTVKNITVLAFICIISIVPLIVINSAGFNFMSLSDEFLQLVENMSELDLMELISFAQRVGSIIVGASILTIVIQIVLHLLIMPAAYGMIQKGITDESAGINDFLPAFKQNFVKYLLYVVGLIVFGIIVGVCSVLILILTGLLANLVGSIGLVLLVLIIIALVCILIYIGMTLTFWFPAILIDNLGIIAALKKTKKIIKGVFWKMFLVHLLVGVIIAVIDAILMNIVGEIVVVGPAISGILSGISTTILLVFVMVVYSDRTGNESAEAET